MSFIKPVLLLVAAAFVAGCATSFDNKAPLGQKFPDITGNSLDNRAVSIPQDLVESSNLLLIGFKQNAQFDIDRWMIGLSMTGTEVHTVELAAIQGIFPRLFKSRIDDGMRNGIPDDLWRAVITVYEDGDRVQAFTGNQRPNNARIVLLDNAGHVLYFHDRGFSVKALNELLQVIEKSEKSYNLEASIQHHKTSTMTPVF